MNRQYTIDAIWAKRVSEKLRTLGLPVNDILNSVDIKLYQLNQKSARITFHQHLELLELAAKASNNDCFALDVAKDIDPRDIGLLAYTVLSSKTLGESLLLTKRYLHVFNEGVDVRLNTSEEGNTIIYFDFIELRQQAAEFGAVIWTKAMRFQTNTQLKPIEISFIHPRKRDIHKFEKFFGCSVGFGTKRNTLTLSPRHLALPTPTADNRLLDILTGYCDEILSDRGTEPTDLRNRVEKIITKLLLKGDVNNIKVAIELGMSTRTLARKLSASGTNFNTILNRLRQDLAMKYLRDVNMSLSQITFLLGYSEVASLYHAFKRWTDLDPSEWRARYVK